MLNKKGKKQHVNDFLPSCNCVYELDCQFCQHPSKDTTSHVFLSYSCLILAFSLYHWEAIDFLQGRKFDLSQQGKQGGINDGWIPIKGGPALMHARSLSWLTGAASLIPPVLSLLWQFKMSPPEKVEIEKKGSYLSKIIRTSLNDLQVMS